MRTAAVVALLFAACGPSKESRERERQRQAAAEADERAAEQRLAGQIRSVEARRGALQALASKLIAQRLVKPPPQEKPCPADVTGRIRTHWSEQAIVVTPIGLAWLAAGAPFPTGEDGPSDPPWLHTPSGALMQWANLVTYDALKFTAEPAPAADDLVHSRAQWRSKGQARLGDFEQRAPRSLDFVIVYFGDYQKTGTILDPDQLPPEATKDGARFTGGAANGTAVVYDAATAAPLCRYRILATQSAKVTAYDPTHALADDLGRNLLDAIGGKLPKGWYPPTR